MKREMHKPRLIKTSLIVLPKRIAIFHCFADTRTGTRDDSKAETLLKSIRLQLLVPPASEPARGDNTLHSPSDVAVCVRHATAPPDPLSLSHSRGST